MNPTKLILGLAIGILGGSAALAQSFPDRPVTLVVPVAAGGSLDTVGRYLGDHLSKEWGQPVVVENRPGAGQVLGANHVAQAQPDGYTLMIVSATFTTTAAVQANLPYDPIESFSPVAMVGNVPLLLALGPSTKATSVDELIAEGRSRSLTYAATGPGSINQFLAEEINQPNDLGMRAVHYQGGTEAMVDLIGGHVDVYFGSIVQLLPTITSGDIRALFVTSPERAKSLPDTPAASELGLESLGAQVWWGVLGPKGMPDDLVASINAEINAIMATEESQIFLDGLGASPASLSSSEFATHLSSELDRWKSSATALGISLN
nr:tripartite tricarboxylate transporter substrate binding protein [uncultured Devosia sp.]